MDFLKELGTCVPELTSECKQRSTDVVKTETILRGPGRLVFTELMKLMRPGEPLTVRVGDETLEIRIKEE
jgi:hypothetical protein